MDKKKKTIVAVVGVACAILLTVTLKVFVFSSKDNNPRRNQLSISTPTVDEHKIDRKSKLEQYERESFENMEKSDVVKELGNLENEKEEVAIEQSAIVGEDKINDQIAENVDNQFTGRSARINSPQSHEAAQVNNELEQLMALQEQLLTQAAYEESQNDNSDIEEIQKLMEAYGQMANAGANPQFLKEKGYINDELSPESLAETNASVNEKLAGHIQSSFKNKSYFHGAGSASQKDDVLGLIPAETVDQGVLVNGSTIAIRTKKEVQLRNPAVLIPKGSIVYGSVSFGTNRLLINIKSYRHGNTLYQLSFSMFDFDGVEGIHLGNRTWPKIPGQVAKDVYDYAYQKGTQAATFGNNDSGIQMDEAKDIAILSAAKEVGKEVFEKRRVFMPKKYHLWFNINEE
ncbi:MAG: hypothetical protein CL613_00450 [Aquimarina sp.]|nr:hypothetical protein [Aquimarina sp.]